MIRSVPERAGRAGAVAGRAAPIAAAIASSVGLALAIAVFAGAPAARPATAGPAARSADAPVAPAIESPTWINTPRLRPEDLAGKVRLVEFWTFGCVNCQRTIPAMNRLQADFARKGLVIVGVHTPEFPREREERYVRDAVAQAGIQFPVALDNDYAIWKAFGNRFWPAIYLVDRDGRIRRTHVGELHVGTPAWNALVRDVKGRLAARRGS